LRRDIEWTCDDNPFASDNRQLTSDVVRSTFKSVSFDECLNAADERAAEAGIDNNEHQFASMNLDKFNNAAKSNGRNNIRLRRMRRQDSNPAKPNLSKQMIDKWTELWTGHWNPNVGVSMRDWYDTVGPIYEQWRLNELNTAKAKGTVPLPLFPVTFVMAKEWANEMKEQSSSPLSLSAFNEATFVMAKEWANEMKGVRVHSMKLVRP
jgi:hypothetical protein